MRVENILNEQAHQLTRAKSLLGDIDTTKMTENEQEAVRMIEDSLCGAISDNVSIGIQFNALRKTIATIIHGI